MTDTVIHDRNPRWMREVENRNPQSKTIKDRPLETKINPPVKLEEVINGVWNFVSENQRLTNEQLKKLSDGIAQTRYVGRDHQRQIENLQKTIEAHQHSIKLLVEHDHARRNRELAKGTERNARKDNSAWSKMKKLLPYKDELENKYIVD